MATTIGAMHATFPLAQYVARRPGRRPQTTECGSCRAGRAKTANVPCSRQTTQASSEGYVPCSRQAWNSLPQRRTLVEHAMAVQAQRNTAGLAELLWTSVGSGADHILRAAEQAQGVDTAVLGPSTLTCTTTVMMQWSVWGSDAKVSRGDVEPGAQSAPGMHRRRRHTRGARAGCAARVPVIRPPGCHRGWESLGPRCWCRSGHSKSRSTMRGMHRSRLGACSGRRAGRVICQAMACLREHGFELLGSRCSMSSRHDRADQRGLCRQRLHQWCVESTRISRMQVHSSGGVEGRASAVLPRSLQSTGTLARHSGRSATGARPCI